MTSAAASMEQRVAQANALIGHAARRRGANEPRLTKSMALLLADDDAAIAHVVRTLLGGADARRLRSRGWTVKASDFVAVHSEVVHAVKVGRLRSRERRRKLDLLFVARRRWALAVEVKLDANPGKEQIEDLLVAPAESFRARDGSQLPAASRLGVLVLAPRELEFAGLRDPERRFLGTVRWPSVIEALQATPLHDAAGKEAWLNLLSLYLRRGCFGKAASQRPTPRVALDALAGKLREHVQRLVGDRHEVALDAGKGRRVTEGGRRSANLELIVRKRRGRIGRGQRVTIWLHAPAKGRRWAEIYVDDDLRTEIRPVPAAIDQLGTTLTPALDAVLAGLPGARQG